MAGNEALRRELDAAMKILEPAAYASRLAELQEQFGHRIKVVDRHGNFNCYAYAFGLSKHPGFVSLVYRTRKTAVMDSAFVSEQLARGRLTEIDSSKIAPGSIALYLDGGPTHAALVREATPQLVLESKWGPSELHSHGLWEVPASYGDQVRFYAPTDIEELLDLLFEKEGLND
jgi:hypothetical protein